MFDLTATWNYYGWVMWKLAPYTSVSCMLEEWEVKL